MTRIIRTLCLTLALCLALPACAAVLAYLPTALAVISDAVLVLQQIEAFARGYFAAHPDPVTQAKIDAALLRARSALDAATRLANGAQALDAKQFAAALADFRAAYDDLLVLVGPIGVHHAVEGLDLGTGYGGDLIVPEPLALRVGR
jgi:hypothetical protein